MMSCFGWSNIMTLHYVMIIHSFGWRHTWKHYMFYEWIYLFNIKDVLSWWLELVGTQQEQSHLLHQQRVAIYDIGEIWKISDIWVCVWFCQWTMSHQNMYVFYIDSLRSRELADARCHWSMYVNKRINRAYLHLNTQIN